MTHSAVLAAIGKTSAAMLFARNLHVLLLPKTVDSLEIYLPMTLDEQPINTLCPKTWTLLGQSLHLIKQPGFIFWPARLVTLSAAQLPEHSACSTL